MDTTAILTLALTTAFGAWAAVVAWGVSRITGQLEKIGIKLDRESERLNEYIVQTERRLAVLEDRINHESMHND